MLRMRPVFGSATTTLPLVVPSAPTAARPPVRSSPSTLSPSVGSTGGVRQTAVRTGAAFLLAAVEVPFGACATANWAPIISPAAASGKRERIICDDPLSMIGKWAVNQYRDNPAGLTRVNAPIRSEERRVGKECRSR